MKIKVLIGLFTLVMVFSCKDKTAENNDGKNNVATETPKPTNVIQLANYSDVNWKNGVGITFKMLLVDFSQEKFDLIYLDPARRDNNNRKVFLLEDLSPNIVEIQEKLGEISDEILIKLSPLIDLQHLVSSLDNISKIWIIAVKNEVKEVLIHIKKTDEETEISCINLQSSEPEFNFTLNTEKNCKSEFSKPEKYIFIPNNSVLKSGAFNLVSEKFNLKKLHQNTHIYTSEKLIEDFPGRIFEAEELNPKEIKKGEKFNIITKNYPLKPEEIKKKYKIKDGGEDYLIFSQSSQNKHILKAKLL